MSDSDHGLIYEINVYLKIYISDYQIYLWLDHPESVKATGEQIVVKDVREENFLLADLIENSTNFAQRTDVMRLEIVHHHGGIYVDIDSTALRSFGKRSREKWGKNDLQFGCFGLDFHGTIYLLRHQDFWTRLILGLNNKIWLVTSYIKKCDQLLVIHWLTMC